MSTVKLVDTALEEYWGSEFYFSDSVLERCMTAHSWPSFVRSFNLDYSHEYVAWGGWGGLTAANHGRRLPPTTTVEARCHHQYHRRRQFNPYS